MSALEFITRSETVHPDYILHLYYEKNADVPDKKGFGSHYRLLLLEKGSGTITLNGTIVPYIAPAILCLCDKDSIDGVSQTGYSVRTLYFLPEVINSNLTLRAISDHSASFTQTELTDLFSIRNFLSADPCQKSVQLGPNEQIRVNELLDSIESILTNPVHEIWPCLARSYFIELLNLIQRIGPAENQAVQITCNEEMRQIINYLNLNYRERITIADITRRYCIDRNTLSRRFLKVTGCTLIEYLNRLRVSVSLQMLRDTTLPVNDIMFRVGFNDPSHFNKTFRLISGTSPSEYRKRYSLFK